MFARMDLPADLDREARDIAPRKSRDSWRSDLDLIGPGREATGTLNDEKLRLRGDSLGIYRVLRVLFLSSTGALTNFESIFLYERSARWDAFFSHFNI